VALIACIGKLITHLNALARNNLHAQAGAAVAWQQTRLLRPRLSTASLTS